MDAMFTFVSQNFLYFIFLLFETERDQKAVIKQSQWSDISSSIHMNFEGSDWIECVYIQSEEELNGVAVHSHDDSSNSSPSTSTMLTTENLGRPQIKRPTSLNVIKPTGRKKNNHHNNK